MKKLSIIIPAYNEENTLATILDKVIKLELPFQTEKEIIIVNDASKDRTKEIAEKFESQYPFVKAITNEKNMGKSQTVKRGLLASTGEYIVIQDADLEYIPNDFADMLELMIRNDYDAVYGNRFGRQNKIIYLTNYIGNRLISFISNIFTFNNLRVWIPDMETCYKLIDGNIARELAESLTATSNFGFEPEITAKLARYRKSNGESIHLGIHPIYYNARSLEEGKKMKAFRDGFKALKEIIYYNLFASQKKNEINSQKEFDFKDIDEEGEETLEVLTLAPRFNKWMFETIHPHSKGLVLEVGSGIGNLTEQYIQNGFDIVASDIRDSYVSTLKEKFTDVDQVKEIINLDIVDPDFDNKYAQYFNKFDTVVALNVVEHIEDDYKAIANIGKLLSKGGNAIILVPAYQALYNRLDQELYHYRRYNIKLLRSRFDLNNFIIKHSFHFNLAGILGWFVSGKLQRNKTLPENQIKIYNALVPVFKIIDRVTMSKVGLSTICISEKRV